MRLTFNATPRPRTTHEWRPSGSRLYGMCHARATCVNLSTSSCVAWYQHVDLKSGWLRSTPRSNESTYTNECGQLLHSILSVISTRTTVHSQLCRYPRDREAHSRVPRFDTHSCASNMLVGCQTELTARMQVRCSLGGAAWPMFL